MTTKKTMPDKKNPDELLPCKNVTGQWNSFYVGKLEALLRASQRLPHRVYGGDDMVKLSAKLLDVHDRVVELGIFDLGTRGDDVHGWVVELGIFDLGTRGDEWLKKPNALDF